MPGTFRPHAVLALVAVLLLGGCTLPGGGEDEPGPGPSPSASAAGTPATAWERAKASAVAKGGVLRLAIGSVPVNLNPSHPDGATSDVQRLLGPTTGSAVRITEDGGWEVDTDYARDVEVVDEDPLRVRVRLEPKAVWQGGSPIRAADMQAYVEAMSGDDDDVEVASTDGWDDVEEVDPADDGLEYTVTFDEPRSDWPLYVYPRLPRNVSKDAERFNEGFRAAAPSSNGPFVVTSIDEKTGTITQERNPRWWGARPRLESVVWRVAAPDVQAEAFEADELDVIDVDPTTVDAVDEERLQVASGNEMTQLTLNAGRGPLRDRDVRRAVAAAVDRRAIATSAAEPVGATPRTAGSLVTLPGQEGYVDTASEELPRGPAAARRLLEKAGYEVSGGTAPKATKDGEQLALDLPVAADTPSVAARADEVAEDLAAVGIAVERRSVKPEDVSQQVLVPRDFDLVTFSWGASLLGVQAAEQRFRPVDSPANLTGVKTGGGSWDDASRELDPRRRARLVAELDEKLLAAAVMVPIAEVPAAAAVREGVVNVGATSFEQPDWTVAGFRAED